jgi:glycosyltransferase involved in cell wall biosynthesis
MSPEERSESLGALGVPGDALVVGIVARLSPVKDHATLLEAASLLATRWPQLHLVLFGEGECGPALRAQAQRLGIAARVHFAGLQSNEQNLHRLFDISVLSSISEGFSNSIVEAMAAARPVVATNVGGTVNAVRPGETGLLVGPRDPGQLASAIERLLRDKDLRERMGAAAQQHAREEYHAAHVLPLLENLYERLSRDAGNLS